MSRFQQCGIPHKTAVKPGNTGFNTSKFWSLPRFSPLVKHTIKIETLHVKQCVTALFLSFKTLDFPKFWGGISPFWGNGQSSKQTLNKFSQGNPKCRSIFATNAGNHIVKHRGAGGYCRYAYGK
jgi:hypothetical protein